MRLSSWEQGIAVSAAADMRMWLWFYEWHMFDAIEPGQHTSGTGNIRESGIRVDEGARRATVDYPEVGIRLDAVARPDGAELVLRIENRSGHDWPPLASIIPCFNPGPEEVRNRRFANTDTFSLGPDGLQRHVAREIRYNAAHREAVRDEADADGGYEWTFKWPESETGAHAGLMIREATGGGWATGIAWERFLSAQAHNPWECMHLSVNVGPLHRGESREIRGRIYLVEGTRDDVLRRYREDFAGS